MQTTREKIEHIYHEWDDALSKLEVERIMALYAPDVTLESPLVRHLLKTDSGILHGRDEVRRLNRSRTQFVCGVTGIKHRTYRRHCEPLEHAMPSNSPFFANDLGFVASSTIS